MSITKCNGYPLIDGTETVWGMKKRKKLKTEITVETGIAGN